MAGLIKPVQPVRVHDTVRDILLLSCLYNCDAKLSRRFGSHGCRGHSEHHEAPAFVHYDHAVRDRLGSRICHAASNATRASSKCLGDAVEMILQPIRVAMKAPVLLRHALRDSSALRSSANPDAIIAAR
jgi:hypothetical protein